MATEYIPSWAELRQMFAETDKKFAETANQSRASEKMLTEQFRASDKMLKETIREVSEEQKKTDKMIKELTQKTDAQIDETGRQIKELTQKTDNQIDKIGKQIKELHTYTDGVGRSNGDFAEDFFYRSLSKNFKLNGVNYNYTLRNVTKHIKKLKLRREYDIILVNDTVLTVVEVKYKLKTVDINKFKDELLRDFRLLFPEYSSFKLFGCLAAMSISDKRLQEAESAGIFVLSQKGEDIELINSKNFKAKLF